MLRKESYIVEERISETGMKCIVMGLREIPEEEWQRRLAEMKAKATEVDSDGSFMIEDDSEWGICGSCRDHSCPVTWYDKEGDEIETSSNCCGGTIHLP